MAKEVNNEMKVTETTKAVAEAEAKKKTSVEYTPIAVPLYADWTGKTIVIGKRGPVKDGKGFRFDFAAPIPANDEEAKKFYGLTIGELVAFGVLNRGYSDGNVVKSMLDEREQKGLPLDQESFVELMAKELGAKLAEGVAVTKRSPKNTKAAELDNLFKTYGLEYGKHTMADLKSAMIAKLTK